MKVTDLDPEFIRWEDRPTPPHINGGVGISTFLPTVNTLAEAHGIEIDCPKCKNHRIHIPFANRGLADHHSTHSSDGRPTRWNVVSGSGFNDLTLTPSIDCTPSNPNCWHGFITNGEVSVL
jgi:hypothetical protein